MRTDILTARTDPGEIRRTTTPPPALEAGAIRVAVETFGLTANNISYAATGDALGYYAYFPAEEGWGRVPVWGFARVTETRCDGIPEGERIFGYLPLASEWVLRPVDAGPLCFSDATAHRTALHPWYNRYYRCAGDPLFSEDTAEVQPVLWALLMTGWRLAEELAPLVDEVFVSSASSKTALSLAWSLAHRDGPARCVGITSEANRAFVESLGVYARVLTYDALASVEAADRVAYVDLAGNAAATSAAHVALGERLVDSVLVGATHRAPSAEPLPMPGPAPRFFFVPNVAEACAAEATLADYHAQFAGVWKPFAGWASGWLSLERGAGADAVEAAYRRVAAGDVPPQNAEVLSWEA
ncbi:MAG: DUF2855 family protein [Myxococcota bacterium]